MEISQKCQSIEEVREQIDEIDRTIIGLIAKRADLVKKAAGFKKSITDVKASDRVKCMMIDRRSWAEEHQMDPEYIEQLFTFIGEPFVKEEITHLENSSEDGVKICDVIESDIEAIYFLQKRAFVQEAEKNGGNYSIVPIAQTLEQLRIETDEFTYIKAVARKQIVGSVRARLIDGTCHIGRVIVEPIFQRCGYGSLLIHEIEKKFPGAAVYELFTAEKSPENIGFYSKNGYAIEERTIDSTGVAMVIMRKHKK
ncbi:MAG TPA: GNAT family N-acetyltransferase [Chitinispirillaceae bacterium]|nr:GNAT family N-acetyltransferase [Chitinispirillaceae bacterium]